jgi:hypothetical protein
MSKFSADKKINLLSAVLFLFGLALISFFNYWWPGIILVIAVAGIFRTILVGNFLASFAYLIIFGGIFLLAQFEHIRPHMEGTWILPAIFVLLGLYILLRCFIGGRRSD